MKKQVLPLATLVVLATFAYNTAVPSGASAQPHLQHSAIAAPQTVSTSEITIAAASERTPLHVAQAAVHDEKPSLPIRMFEILSRLSAGIFAFIKAIVIAVFGPQAWPSPPQPQQPPKPPTTTTNPSSTPSTSSTATSAPTTTSAPPPAHANEPETKFGPPEKVGELEWRSTGSFSTKQRSVRIANQQDEITVSYEELPEDARDYMSFKIPNTFATAPLKYQIADLKQNKPILSHTFATPLPEHADYTFLYWVPEPGYWKLAKTSISADRKTISTEMNQDGWWMATVIADKSWRQQLVDAGAKVEVLEMLESNDWRAEGKQLSNAIANSKTDLMQDNEMLFDIVYHLAPRDTTPPKCDTNDRRSEAADYAISQRSDLNLSFCEVNEFLEADSILLELKNHTFRSVRVTIDENSYKAGVNFEGSVFDEESGSTPAELQSQLIIATYEGRLRIPKDFADTLDTITLRVEVFNNLESLVHFHNYSHFSSLLYNGTMLDEHNLFTLCSKDWDSAKAENTSSDLLSKVTPYSECVLRLIEKEWASNPEFVEYKHLKNFDVDDVSTILLSQYSMQFMDDLPQPSTLSDTITIKVKKPAEAESTTEATTPAESP